MLRLSIGINFYNATRFGIQWSFPPADIMTAAGVFSWGAQLDPYPCQTPSSVPPQLRMWHPLPPHIKPEWPEPLHITSTTSTARVLCTLLIHTSAQVHYTELLTF